MSLMIALEDCLLQEQVLVKIQERKQKQIEADDKEEKKEEPFFCKTRFALETAPLVAAREWEMHIFGMPITTLS